MSAEIYAVIDPSDDPSVVSTPPLPRKPVRKDVVRPPSAVEQALAESDTLLSEAAAAPSAPPVPTSTPKPRYTRVQFITDVGVYSVPALSVTVGVYGIMVELPSDNDTASFIPAVGTKLAIGNTVDRYNCYYPGTEFDRPGSKVLVFIRTQEEGETHGKA